MGVRWGRQGDENCDLTGEQGETKRNRMTMRKMGILFFGN